MSRFDLGNKYAYGKGLEIAPFHNPWPLNPNIKEMTYLDLFTADELRQQYPEHRNDKITETTIIDDGQFCEKIETDSMDFVFSSHVLEHCPHTIETIRNWLRVVKKDGYVIMAIPLKDNPIDRNREPTKWEHLLGEFEHNISTSCEHYMEYHSVVDHLEGDELYKRVSHSMNTRPHIHFHCWDTRQMEDMWIGMSIFEGFKLQEIVHMGWETFVVLKKTIGGNLKWKMK